MRFRVVLVLVLAAVAALSAATSSQAAADAPTGLVVTGVDATEARLDWDSVWPRDYYVAYLYDAQGTELRRERSNGPQGNTSSQTWTDLAPCTTYQADVSYVESGVESLPSSRVTFTTTGCDEPPPPVEEPPLSPAGGLVVTGVGATEARLDWDSVWPRDSYVAYLYDGEGGELRRERSNGPDGNTSSHTWEDLAPCTTYQADASYLLSGAESPKSDRVSFATSCPTDQVPPTDPPPADGGTGWAGFSSPLALPPLGWRPYRDDAAWNRGTADATVHPNSAAMVDYLRSTAGGRMENIAVPDDTGSAPVYWADADDPLYTIWCRQWVSSCEVHGKTVRIPAGALPTRAYDRHLVSVQPDGTEVDLWEADDPSGTGGDLWVSHGGMTRIDGDSTGSNAVASMTGAVAGQFRSVEWMADQIHHALQLVVPRDSGRYVYPAGKTGSSDPSSSPVPMGQWFKLEISDGELAAEPPWRRALYRAMRDYGLFVVDTGSRFGIEHENPLTFTAFGLEDPARAWLLGQAGVDRWTNSSTGNLNAVARTPDFPFDKLVALNPPPRP